MLAGILIALPRFVASNAHRHTIEALASSLTGRQVHIAGNLSLALLPAPQLIAGDVSIGGPAEEIITARSLTLDIALPALLRGQLAARSLTLQSPRIMLPWPLPGGAATIAPPPWLAALHAQISDGTVSIGAVMVTGVDADIFTAKDGALSVSGTGLFEGAPLTLSLGLSAPDAAGRAALAIDSRVPDGTLGGHFSGVLEGNSAVAGHLNANFRLPGAAAAGAAAPGDAASVLGSANIDANAQNVTVTDIHLSRDDATLIGSATFDLKKPAFALDLNGNNLSAAALLPLLTPGRIGFPGRLTLSVRNLQLPAGALPEAEMQAVFGAEGIALNRLAGTLPGGGTVSISGKIDASGGVTAQAAVQADDLSSLAAAFGDAALARSPWRQLRAQAALRGNRDDLNVTDLRATLGVSRATGSFVLRQTDAGMTAQGALHFDRMDLAAMAAVLRDVHLMSGLVLAGELSADHANYGQLQLGRLLLDAEISKQVVVRRFSAAVYDGVAIGNLTLAPDATLVAAQARVAVPSASPLAALLPETAAAPAVLFHAPLNLSAAAAGRPGALGISAVGNLGDIVITANPVIDIPARTALGPLTLRHPNAIAALSTLGMKAGLAWPGAGSIALRADMLVSPTQYGLPDFVLSFGDLTAGGKVMVAASHVTADIAADTLALPASPLPIALPWTRMTDQINATLAANRVWFGGQQFLGASAATLTMTPGHLNFMINRAALGGGNLSGGLSATFGPGLSPAAGRPGAGPPAPALALELNFTNVDAASLALPIAFPYTILAGSLTGGASLTAGGFAPAAWAATLGGSAALSAVNGQLNGFDLAAFRQALQSPQQAGRKQAASSGVSDFTQLAINGMFDHGTFSLKTVGLQGPDGSAAATGSIDLPDRAIAVHITLSPSGTPPISTTVTSVGSWAAPQKVLAPSP